VGGALQVQLEQLHAGGDVAAPVSARQARGGPFASAEEQAELLRGSECREGVRMGGRDAGQPYVACGAGSQAAGVGGEAAGFSMAGRARGARGSGAARNASSERSARRKACTRRTWMSSAGADAHPTEPMASSTSRCAPTRGRELSAMAERASLWRLELWATCKLRVELYLRLQLFCEGNPSTSSPPKVAHLVWVTHCGKPV
jgi:hypothetical protein